MIVMICAETIIVGLGEMKVVKDQSAVLTCVGVGSCIVICAYDPVAKIGGMVHAVLPNSGDKDPSPRYVDTGLPLLLDEMEKQGAVMSRVVVKVAGGAEMLSIPGFEGYLNIGKRNVVAVMAALAQQGIDNPIADVGGNFGRTVRLFLDSGKVVASTVMNGDNVEL